jgi:mono/diheme cytochrome c family protein
MSLRSRLTPVLITGAALVAAALPGALTGEVTEGERLFALHVKEILSEKCVACHSSDEDKKLKGGLELTSREKVLAGGDSGEVLVPGDAAGSLLYIATTWEDEDYEMPPKEADRLSDDQQWKVRDWINAGAPWPDDERVAALREKFATGEVVKTSGGLGHDWTNRRYESGKLWAYRPLEVTEVPAGEHPVDWFIDRQLEAVGLAPAAGAGARELARRLSFGLTGLPPKPAEAREFERACETDRAAAVGEYGRELMESPHYGEHFGRQWLDVARYADSAGFANDYTRPNAWRYRDYVVRAFNDDKPYDQFVREQVAGDEIDDSDPEKLVATGFLRMGPWEQTGMSVFRVTRQQWLDDVTDSVGQTFLAHAMQCAKCHDHKFDPVPTRDYYRMMAVFSTTQFADREAPFLEDENREGFEASEQWVHAKQSYYQRQQKALKERIAKLRKKETGAARTGNNNLDPGDEASQSRITKNLSRHEWELDRTKPIAFSVHTGKTVERKNVSSRLGLPKEPWGQGYMEKDAILTGGDAYTRGDPVTPGSLSAAENLGGMDQGAFPAGKGRRRLALAEWIVDGQNPLTARVMVNRVWGWHFGRGIAGNPNNFGGTGALPTHPELLDYLADWFMRNGWSVKRLNELILSSAAYRRSAAHPDPEDLAGKDPGRQLYAAFLPRRLTAEELRDSMLAASGELNRQVGGIPSRPDVNMEVALQPRQIMGGTASVYEPDPLPAQRNRRSIYAEKTRGLRDPFFETFNQPGPDKSCELRETSTVAPQALTLFNSEEVMERSIAFAVRLLGEGSRDEAVVNRAFELALGRPVTPEEAEACLTMWRKATREEKDLAPEPNKFPNGVKRTVMAEKTGEPYSFWEHMPAYNDYQPDLQRSDVDARTRGLAQVCLVIFNLNEFAYLD